MDTAELMSQTREQRLSEVGTEPACPFCQRPRVTRSDYIRCNKCGVNWLDSEMEIQNYLDVDPRVARLEAARMNQGTKSSAAPSKADVEAFTLPSR